MDEHEHCHVGSHDYETTKEEILELIWTQLEMGEDGLDHLVKIAQQENPAEILERMQEEGLLTTADNKVTLTDPGEKAAEVIVRRHRLAEMLLSQVLDLGHDRIHREACKFEHILSPEVTDSVCTFLGHPPSCPHGKKIPRGECCTGKRDLKPLVTSLKDMDPGEKGRIVFITPKDHETLDRLSSLGVVPGCIIRLHQKRPTFVIKIEETDLALDENIAQDIYVKRQK